jgi:hypothetical protein
MHARKLFSITLLGFALAAGFTGCRSSNAYDPDVPMERRVLLSVKNDNFLDMDIYAVSSGLATRVGTATGLATARFALSPALWEAGDFRIVAAPIGGNGRASSGALAVHSGDQIDFTIASTLRQSHAEVRSQ